MWRGSAASEALVRPIFCFLHALGVSSEAPPGQSSGCHVFVTTGRFFRGWGRQGQSLLYEFKVGLCILRRVSLSAVLFVIQIGSHRLAATKQRGHAWSVWACTYAAIVLLSYSSTPRTRRQFCGTSRQLLPSMPSMGSSDEVLPRRRRTRMLSAKPFDRSRPPLLCRYCNFQEPFTMFFDQFARRWMAFHAPR